MVRRLIAVAAAAWCMAFGHGAFTSPLHAAQEQGAGQLPVEPTIHDGVFTAAQAERGKVVYMSSCVRCHMADMSGNTGPSLKGERFLSSWENDTLDGLWTKVRDTMPPRIGNAVLTDDAKIDVVAYLLSANGFPAGREELTINPAALERVEIIRSDRIGQVRNFALVQLVGCVAAGSGNAWMLTHAGEPVVAKHAFAALEDAPVARAKPLGADSYALVSAARFNPASLRGQKVEAKGLVYRVPGRNMLTLTALQTVAPNCGN